MVIRKFYLYAPYISRDLGVSEDIVEDIMLLRKNVGEFYLSLDGSFSRSSECIEYWEMIQELSDELYEIEKSSKLKKSNGQLIRETLSGLATILANL